MICVEPNNQNNDKKFRNSVTNYKEKFNEFVENLKNESNIEDNLGIKGLKVLKVNTNDTESNKRGNKLFTCACFHPNQIWIFSGGEDGKIRMWC